MRKIVITTDFSPEAAKNIERVLELLRDSRHESSILLLNTYLVPSADPSRIIELNDELKKKSREGLARAKAEASAQNKNPLVTIETASHMGSVYNVVQNLLGKDKYETVSFCESGPEKLAEVIHGKNCPILITCA